MTMQVGVGHPFIMPCRRAVLPREPPAARADISAGQFHLVLAPTSTDPRLRWIAAHCRRLGRTSANLHVYFCLPTDAG